MISVHNSVLNKLTNYKCLSFSRELLEKSGSETGDRMWRMPLFKHYTKQMTGMEHCEFQIKTELKFKRDY